MLVFKHYVSSTAFYKLLYSFDRSVFTEFRHNIGRFRKLSLDKIIKILTKTLKNVFFFDKDRQVRLRHVY